MGYKIAFVGAGNMSGEHAKAFAAVDFVSNVGVFSRTELKAQALAQKFSMSHVARSVVELYQRTHADAVVISVSELSTLSVCQEVFKFPWKVLIEKPAGYDVADAKKILTLANEHKTQAFVAFNRRHYHSTRRLVDELARTQGPRFIQVLDQEDPAAARKAGRPELVVKNWMYANSIHLIDFFTFLGRGEITSVEPIVRWTPENPSHVVAKISYSSGDVGLYEAAWNRPGPWAVTATVAEARYEMRPIEQIGIQAYGSRKLEPIPQHEWDVNFKPGLRLQVEEMLKVLRGEPHALPTLEDSLRSMELVQQIYCSAM